MNAYLIHNYNETKSLLCVEGDDILTVISDKECTKIIRSKSNNTRKMIAEYISAGHDMVTRETFTVEMDAIAEAIKMPTAF